MTDFEESASIQKEPSIKESVSNQKEASYSDDNTDFTHSDDNTDFTHSDDNTDFTHSDDNTDFSEEAYPTEVDSRQPMELESHQPMELESRQPMELESHQPMEVESHQRKSPDQPLEAPQKKPVDLKSHPTTSQHKVGMLKSLQSKGFFVTGKLDVSWSNFHESLPSQMIIFVFLTNAIVVEVGVAFLTSLFSGWNTLVTVSQMVKLVVDLISIIAPAFLSQKQKHHWKMIVINLTATPLAILSFIIALIHKPFFPGNRSLTWTLVVLTFCAASAFLSLQYVRVPKGTSRKVRVIYCIKIISHWVDVNSDIAMAVALIMANESIFLAAVIIFFGVLDSQGFTIYFFAVSPATKTYFIISILMLFSEIPVLVACVLAFQRGAIDDPLTILSIVTTVWAIMLTSFGLVRKYITFRKDKKAKCVSHQSQSSSHSSSQDFADPDSQSVDDSVEEARTEV